MDISTIRFRVGKVADPRGVRLYTNGRGDMVATFDPTKIERNKVRREITDLLLFFKADLADRIIEQVGRFQ